MMKYARIPTLFLIFSLGVWTAAATSGKRLDSAFADTRERFHALLDRPRVPMRPELKSTADGDMLIERGSFHSDAHEIVPFIAFKQSRATGRLPAVILLHGTGGSKRGMEGLAKELAGQGFLALAIDARFHGERVPGGAHGSQEYQEAIIRAWKEPDPKKQAHPFYYDTVYDLWRTVDYLESRRDVDRKRIGMLGISMGGIETWLAAATDSRIAVAAPLIGVQSLRWSLENEKWQGRAGTVKLAHDSVAKDLGEPVVNARVCRALWNKLIPGILDEFDCPNMLREIAPRPLLILNGENDPNCPLEGAKLAFAAAEAAYRKAGAEDHLKVDVAAGVGHAVTVDHHRMAVDWLKRWLKPQL